MLFSISNNIASNGWSYARNISKQTGTCSIGIYPYTIDYILNDVAQSMCKLILIEVMLILTNTN